MDGISFTFVSDENKKAIASRPCDCFFHETKCANHFKQRTHGFYNKKIILPDMGKKSSRETLGWGMGEKD
ncbi:hypothetical protein [Hydrogenovibrio halophilus]|uniref:hypothetical protein n=1 Tax=Hydrogenovibrio halophilus TaxID=373391 RepID=UPI0012FDB249|nr:hypothetical protein [Hydrogenovibrio halophilus]